VGIAAVSVWRSQALVTAYYNEIDPFAAEWLRNLIAAGHIAPGYVDERPIQEVKAEDLEGYVQCHFFAGIGGWSYALRLAGWADDRPVWTGSCPCQPFSAAGKRKGAADDRHLWPVFFSLIRQCRPDVVFGEQVSSKDGLSWFDAVSVDLEGAGYAIGALDTCAAGVGAPHIRQRLYFVADFECWAAERRRYDLGKAESRSQEEARERERLRIDIGSSGKSDRLEHADKPRLEGRSMPAGQRGNQRSPWAASDAVWCRDGESRPIEPGLEPLVDGVPARVGRLRGYGNAIVPQVAQALIESYMEVSG
jgi:DNA (cytosine-5)-methyltransferase 1